MPQENYIAKILDIKDVTVSGVENTEDQIEIHIQMPVREHVCPKCGAITTNVHDYRIQKVKDIPIQEKNLIWFYRKRRYRRPCCGKRFYETNYLLPKGHRITNRPVACCLRELRRKGSMKDIADRLGISESTVGRWLKLLNTTKSSVLPKVLSIDEFKGNCGGAKFQCILTDAENKSVFDILPNRTQSVLIDYFREFSNRDRVEYVVMDMNRAFLETAKVFFPKAKVIIDRFHVARYITWAFENVRKRFQKNLFASDRKYFKHSRKLLLARSRTLSDENKDAVSIMLSYSGDLTDAYYLKECFYEFMDADGKDAAEEKMREFLFKAKTLNLPEFQPCIRMLENWKEYILNSFEHPYSNGYTEGMNNTIKTLKRLAFGFRNFDSFRARILSLDHQKRSSPVCV